LGNAVTAQSCGGLAKRRSEGPIAPGWRTRLRSRTSASALLSKHCRRTAKRADSSSTAPRRTASA